MLLIHRRMSIERAQVQNSDAVLTRVSRICWVIAIVGFTLNYFGVADRSASFVSWGAIIVGFTVGMIFNIRVLINKFRKD